MKRLEQRGKRMGESLLHRRVTGEEHGRFICGGEDDRHGAPVCLLHTTSDLKRLVFGICAVDRQQDIGVLRLRAGSMVTLVPW